jgi:hypothetical protein
MVDEGREKRLPIRGLHEFLFEINREWDQFRTGSLVTMILSGVLIVILLPRLLVFQWRRGEIIETLFQLGIIIVLAYNLYVGYKQHDFYKKWEKRIGLLIHTEEELLGND